MAERQGLRLLKSRRRDPYADGYGTYALVDGDADPADETYGHDLDEIERQLRSRSRP
jgi:hypothetical protein